VIRRNSPPKAIGAVTLSCRDSVRNVDLTGWRPVAISPLPARFRAQIDFRHHRFPQLPAL